MASPSTKARRGPVRAVPCPHCGAKNDFSHLQEGNAVRKNNVYGCDKCGKKMRVSKVVQVPVIYVVQFNRSMADDKRYETFEARKPQCCDASCSSEQVKFIRCGACGSDGDDHKIYYCASHPAAATAALQAHMKLEHAAMPPERKGG